MKDEILLEIMHYAKKRLDDVTDDEILKVCNIKGYLDCLLAQCLINDKEYRKLIKGLS